MFFLKNGIGSGFDCFYLFSCKVFGYLLLWDLRRELYPIWRLRLGARDYQVMQYLSLQLLVH